MPLSSVATQHLQELAARKSKLYELLIALEANSSADDSSFESLGKVVDRALFNEISLDDAALRELNAFVAAPAPDLASTLAVLDVALSEAEPDRSRLRLLLTGFPKWLRAASDVARPQFLSILPNIAAHLNDLGNSGVESLIAGFNACSSEANGDLLARCIDRYQETSGEISAAAADIAILAIRANSAPMLEQLISAVNPEAMYESKDSRVLLPAIAALKNPGAAAVCIEVARTNHSSALHLAKSFGDSLSSLSAGLQPAYLTAFRRIVKEAGISMVGYGSKQLLGIFKTSGPDRANEFVADGIAIARRYGKVAAQEFFEQKTPASKRASPLG